jgi:beta-lactamase class D
MKLLNIFVLILIIVLLLTGHIAKGAEHPEWETYFKDYGGKGCFILYDLHNDRYDSYNLPRCEERFLPASTFKIFNSLVALETGVIADEKTIIPWDGVDRGFTSWNKDQDMQSAIKNSTVWFYQELARRIGQERMQHYINLVGYGNKDISGGIDVFWLQGGLRISPQEQIEFLKRLYRNALPFSQRTIDIVKQVLVYEQTDAYTMRAKTGWVSRVKPEIGWFVGYVEQQANVYFFAINLELSKQEDQQGRFDIPKKIFHTLGIL